MAVWPILNAGNLCWIHLDAISSNYVTKIKQLRLIKVAFLELSIQTFPLQNLEDSL